MKKKLLLVPFMLLITSLGICQSSSTDKISMATAFRDNGKIYVVAGVVIIILVLTILHLFSIERKLSKIEKQIK